MKGRTRRPATPERERLRPPRVPAAIVPSVDLALGVARSIPDLISDVAGDVLGLVPGVTGLVADLVGDVAGDVLGLVPGVTVSVVA